MPNFRQLIEKASGIAKDVLKNPPVTYYFSSFFCPCLPSLTDIDITRDIEKIEETVKVLKQFYQEDEEIKLEVLQGLYFLILSNYETTLKQLVYRPMVTVLLSHLELDCLQSIRLEVYRKSMDSLEEFIKQVHRNNRLIEMAKIVEVLPLQLIIEIRSYTNLDETNDGSWSASLSDFLKVTGINRLF